MFYRRFNFGSKNKILPAGGNRGSVSIHRSTARSSRLNSGFSLIELLVVVAISVLLASVVLIENSRTNYPIIVTDTAYDIALLIRQAENYGVNVRQAVEHQSGYYTAGYGIHVTTNPANTLTFFVDTQNNFTYDGSDKVITNYAFERGISILKICGVKQNGQTSCSESGSPVGFDIVFTRPNPEPVLTALIGGGVVYTKALICVSAPSTISKAVAVTITGQISVQNCP